MSHPLINADHEALFAETFIGVLATLRHRDGYLSANPVSYYWNGETFEISTLKSRVKYRNLCAEPLASLCIVSPQDPMKYLEVRGRVRLQDDPGGQLMKEGFRRITGMDPPADLDPPGAERAMIYLIPEQVSSPAVYGGRFDR
jgi:PPOX class probable F420-dependent enzyme